MPHDAAITRQQPKQPIVTFRSAYARFSLVLLAITIVSLIPQYFRGLLNSPEPMSLELIVHGAAFLGWYLLFTVQAGLAGSGNLSRHRALGYASLPFAAFLIVSGALMMLGTMRSYDPSWSAALLQSRTSFVWAIAHTLVSFTSFYGLAIVYRRRPQAHQRLMLLASLSMMAASITRFAFLPFIPINGTAFTLLLSYALLFTPLVIDRRQRGRIHPALLIGTALYVVTQLLAMGLMPATQIGRALAFGI